MRLDIPLVIEDAPYRNVNEMILHHVEEAQNDLKKKESVTVILPQFVMKKKRFHALHNQTSIAAKAAAEQIAQCFRCQCSLYHIVRALSSCFSSCLWGRSWSVFRSRREHLTV